MIKKLIDRAETLLAYLIVGLIFFGAPVALFIHGVTTVWE